MSVDDRPATLTARSLARRELTRAIVAEARRQLAEVGPAQLSVRAVARALGMASSAVYRYFPSRDDLLTALLVIGYDELGEVVEQADARVRRRADYGGRWLALADAVRDWARAHPHDYALLYGSPVPGYAAPADTIEPATRVIRVLVDLLGDASEAGQAPEPVTSIPRAARRAVAPVRAFAGRGLGDDLVYRALVSWGGLLGACTLELFGHLHNAIDDFDAWFAQTAIRLSPVAAS